LAQRWETYRPTKALLLWTGAGCAALTMIIGFSWGGWVTGRTATSLADSAATRARSELAASICVSRFMGAADAGVKLAELKAVSSWQRDDFVEKGGWATVSGSDEPVRGAAELCSTTLAEMSPPAQAAAEKPTVLQ
jgi:hypothetical protein